MAVIGRFLSWLITWLRRGFARARFQWLERVTELTDTPAILRPDTLYVAGPATQPKWAVFECPCDRGHQVTLSLQRSHYPHWHLQLETGRPTIYPSIDVPNETRCHYWIVRGRVRWARTWPATTGTGGRDVSP